MKKILSVLLVLVMMFSLCSVVASAETAATEVESNDTAQTATAITGTSITGALSDKNDVDWYKFEADKDYFEVDFKVNANDLGEDTKDGWNVRIYDSAMNEIKVYTNGIENFETPKFAISDTIYVKINAYNGVFSPNGIAYDLVVTKTEDDHWEDETNGASNTAQVINANEKYTASMWKKDDQDWFKFTSLDYFVIDFGVNMQLATDVVENEWNVYIYDSSLQEIATYSSVVDFVSAPLAFEGDVYVKVINQNQAYNNNYIYYDITAYTYADATWETENNDASNTANTISIGTKYTGNLYKGGDVDYFKFKATTNAFKVKFDIDLNEVSADKVEDGWRVTVYPVDSASPITSYSIENVGSFESITLPYTKGKEYFVKVEACLSAFAPKYQPYHITVVDATAGKKWEVENGGTDFKSATTLADNSKVYGNLVNGKDVDIYKYTVAAKGALKVSFARPDSADDVDGFKVTLKNAAGTVVKTATYDDVLKGSFSGVVYKGTYYVVVEAALSSYAPSNKIDYALTAAYTLAKPTLSTVAASGKKAVKATWKKVSDINGYQLQFSTSKTFSSAKTVTVNKNSTVSYTYKASASKKTYYVRMRSYVKVGSKVYYSAWTTAKSAKTK